MTLSREQASLARQRAEELGVADRVEVRVQDYRDVDVGPFDAVASVGMAEHVGGAQLPVYARRLHDLVRPGGRVLNHAIASVRPVPSGRPRRGFIQRYIFPDGELQTLATSLRALEQGGLEVRDVESLREHYAQTLHAWVDNLRAAWDEAVRLVPEARARTWLLYLAVSALAFDHGNLTVHQAVAVRQGSRGAAGFPRTRAEWLRGRA